MLPRFRRLAQVSRAQSETPARVDIIVDSLEGHRPFYLRLCLRYGADRGIACHVHAPGSVSDLGTHDADLLQMAVWHFDSDVSTVEYLATLDSDHVLLLDGDALARSTFWRFGWSDHAPAVALSLRGQRPRWNSDPTKLVKSVVRYIISERLRRRRGVRVIHLISPIDPGAVSADQVKDPVPIDCTPEDAADFIREHLESLDGTDRFWVGVVGSINHRKNVGIIAEALAAAHASGDLERPGLLLAGMVADNCRQEVTRAQSLLETVGVPVVILDQLLDDVTFDAALAALDAVVVAYSNDGPSGVLAKAARLGTRVVAAGSPWLRDDIRSLGSGAWGKLTVDGIRRALTEAVAQPAPAPATHLGTDEFAPTLLGRRSLRILAWPAFRHRAANSYTADLADQLATRGHLVREFGLNRNLLRRQDLILLHWPEFAPTHPSTPIRFLASPVVLAVLSAHQALGAKLVWTIHNVRPHDDPSPLLRRRFMALLAKRLDGVIALNHTSLQEARLAYPALVGSETLVTRHPAYAARRAPGREFQMRQRSDIGRFLDNLALDLRVFVAWGKMANYKQLELLAAEASGLGAGTLTIIAGRCPDASLESRLRAEERDHPDRLKVFTGHIADGDLVELLERADAAIFNFSDITNSGSVIASLSQRCPVIAPFHPGLDELGMDLGSDWVRLFDPPLTAAKLQKLIDIPDPTGPGINEHEAYQWPTVGERTGHFLMNLAGRGGHGDP